MWTARSSGVLSSLRGVTFSSADKTFLAVGDADAIVQSGVTTPGSSTTTSGGGGHCFIATAVYGSYWAPEVLILRAFRDTYLLTNPAGRLFVDLYYRYSPALASRVEGSAPLRMVARACLAPLVFVIAHPLAVLFVVPAAFIIVARRIRRPRRISRTP
jgi:hypothetical protein